MEQAVRIHRPALTRREALTCTDVCPRRSTLHMSDPRPILESRTIKRKVIQIRVALRPEGAGESTMVFNPEHPNNFLLSGWASLHDKRKVGAALEVSPAIGLPHD